MTYSTSGKSGSFSGAHRPRHPQGVDPDDPALFGHSAPSSTDGSRRERQGDGKCTGLTDPRYFSNFKPDPAHATNTGRAVERDSEGDFAFSENLSAGAHEAADRIRRRER
jgi:hypothetical protein